MLENEFKIKGFVVWLICALFFLYEFFLRTVTGTFQLGIMQSLGLSIMQFSLLSSTIFHLIYGLMQLPVGFIIDHIGLKKSLVCGAFLCAISSFGFALSANFELAILARSVMGLGASFGFITVLVAVNDWMPSRYRALFIGLSQFIGTIGPMFAAGPLEEVIEQTGTNWREIFIYLGFVGVFLTIISFLLVDNNTEKTSKYIILRRPEKLGDYLKKLFSRIQPWYIAIISSCLFFTVEYLTENEGRNFLVNRGVAINSAGYMLTISWFGYAVGCPILGFLSDYMQNRKFVLKFSAILGLVSICSIIYMPKEFLAIAFMGLGISTGGQTVGFAMMAEHFKKEFVAFGFGLNNAVIVLVSALNAPFIGGVIDSIKQTDYPILEDHISAFSILIAIYIIGVFVSFVMIKETYCKSMVDFTFLKPKKNIQ